ncbi:MAG: MBL fold metallo-hydrolase [Acidimicrobiia bacterium]|nr:MBL fold metallo-hydrolase [Acidimicrobiia bacterium]
MTWKIEIGTSVLYGIQDGRSTRDPHAALIGSTPEAWHGYEHFLNEDGTLPNSFSCYLFDTGADLVMIDSGFGMNAPDGTDAGNMPAALAALDISPADVDHVVFTHLHPDHILGSLNQDQAPLFANAAHWTLAREVEHWRAQTDERSQGIVRVASTLHGAGVLQAVDEPGPVTSGVTTVATYGHTPGHTAVRVSSGDDAVLLAGDVTFSPIQIHYTDWAFPLDVDKEAASVTRAAFFDELAESGVPFVAGHYDQPGYGRVLVTSEGRTYEALPVEQMHTT